ncbi:hypothetical protein HZD82_27250, partial [Pantoea agglomerans]|uniref:hypothetical protein n=1 Tax=Enterobacter agglomerans TaxID=549 RepID=UPI001A9090D2
MNQDDRLRRSAFDREALVAIAQAHLHLGILLNLPIFYRRFDGFLRHSTVTNWLTAVTEVMAIVVLT